MLTSLFSFLPSSPLFPMVFNAEVHTGIAREEGGREQRGREWKVGVDEEGEGGRLEVRGGAEAE
eukprot:1633928-Rhodomonas_salina.1